MLDACTLRAAPQPRSQVVRKPAGSHSPYRSFSSPLCFGAALFSTLLGHSCRPDFTGPGPPIQGQQHTVAIPSADGSACSAQRPSSCGRCSERVLLNSMESQQQWFALLGGFALRVASPFRFRLPFCICRDHLSRLPESRAPFLPQALKITVLPPPPVVAFAASAAILIWTPTAQSSDQNGYSSRLDAKPRHVLGSFDLKERTTEPAGSAAMGRIWSR